MANWSSFHTHMNVTVMRKVKLSLDIWRVKIPFTLRLG